MTLKVAARGIVPPFIVMDMMRAANRRAAQGQDVLHLEVGQPSGGAPATALEAGRKAMLSEPLGYTEALGNEALRHRLARLYRDRYGVDVAPERVVLTIGSSGAFLLAFLSAFAAGDRVGVAAPSYPAYRNILFALGIEPVLLAVDADSHFQTDVALLRRHGAGLDGLIVASPSNPTGSMLEPESLRAVAATANNRATTRSTLPSRATQG